MAPALWRTIMPTPSPITAASASVEQGPEARDTTSPTRRPPSAPPRTAPANPATIPVAPSASPTAAAIVVLADTITQRAGRAVSVTASVPCWASPVNIRIPVTMASVATSGSG